MATPKGYSSQTKDERLSAEFATIQPIGNGKHALDVNANLYQFAYSPAAVIAAVINDTDSTDVIGLNIVAHGAIEGDLVDFLDGLAIHKQVRVSSVLDANNFYLSETIKVAVAPVAADTVDLMRPKQGEVTSTGAISVTSGPTLFTLDGADQAVTEDTVTPANNRALPVKLTGVTGDINITANDLNVQLVHTGATPDSTQIGDGTEILLITAAGEALTQPNGNVADNAADSGNPVKVGGKYNLAAPTYGDGDRADLQVDVNGKLLVETELSTVADNAADTGDSLKVGSVYNAADPTYDDGDRADLQSNINGHLKTYDKVLDDKTLGFDLDTGAGTETNLGVNLRLSANGGSVEAGTAADPLRTDPTGTTTQPISDGGGSITVDDGGASLTVDAVDLDIRDLTHVSDSVMIGDGTETANVNASNELQVTDDVLNAKVTAFDLDSGGGTENNQGVSIRLTAGGGSVEAGTTTNPFVVSPHSAVADNAADSENPIKIGGRYNLAEPTYGDGDKADLQMDVNGKVKTVTTLNDSTSHDLDTGGGTENNIGISLRGSASGGSIEIGTETNPIISSAADTSLLDIVDLPDTPLIAGSSINGSAGAFFEVTASLAADVKEIDVYDTTGDFLGWYTGAAASEVLKFVSGPGFDHPVPFKVSSGERISVRGMEAAVSGVGSTSVNFLG
jgi:hypothetical protein